MGKAALEGLPGIYKVTSGWHGLSEVNRVWYDPEQISLERMINALKMAGTYKGRVEEGE